MITIPIPTELQSSYPGTGKFHSSGNFTFTVSNFESAKEDITSSLSNASDFINFDDVERIFNERMNSFIDNMELRKVFIGGSGNNTENQQFDIDLNNTHWQIGDQVKLHNFEFRGDVGSATELIAIGADNITNTKAIVGDYASGEGDTANWVLHTQYPEPEIIATVTDIGSGTKGIQLFCSPDVSVNFVATDMTNWWELRCSIIKA